MVTKTSTRYFTMQTPATKNFNPNTDPKLLCTCGHQDCDERSVSQWVLDNVQKIRDDAQRPIQITSGGRCPNHTNELRRLHPADHQKCIAVDIAVANSQERAEIVELGLKYGATAIGPATTFVHLGWRPNSVNVMWLYPF